jgi:hypothetical protein
LRFCKWEHTIECGNRGTKNWNSWASIYSQVWKIRVNTIRGSKSCETLKSLRGESLSEIDLAFKTSMVTNLFYGILSCFFRNEFIVSSWKPL